MPALAEADCRRDSCRVVGIRASIEINQHYTYKVYTPGSLISGHVRIETPCDVVFNGIEIAFVGTTVTRNYIQPEPEHAARSFMKLSMPIDETSFPTGHVFKADRVYTVPFHFVVPVELLMGSCKHRCKNTAVQERHLRLPPSMGFCPGNDQSPNEARVVYSIVAAGIRTLWELPVPVPLFRAHKTIRVLPMSPEDAPLDVCPDTSPYLLSRTQCLWKTFFTGREGELTASASQPSAVMLSPDGTEASYSTINLKLEYIPSSLLSTPAPAPPRIKSVSGKIITTTFFQVSPITRLPSMEMWRKNESRPYQHTTSHKVFDQPVDKLLWTGDAGVTELQARRASYPLDSSHTLKRPQILVRHHSEDSDSSTPTSLRTEMNIHFTIPHGNKNFFLPSFDSCLVSRAYALRLSISLGAVHTNLVLKLPLQIGVEGADAGGELDTDWMRTIATVDYNMLPEYKPIL